MTQPEWEILPPEPKRGEPDAAQTFALFCLLFDDLLQARFDDLATYARNEADKRPNK